MPERLPLFSSLPCCSDSSIPDIHQVVDKDTLDRVVQQAQDKVGMQSGSPHITVGVVCVYVCVACVYGFTCCRMYCTLGGGVICLQGMEGGGGGRNHLPLRRF